MRYDKTERLGVIATDSIITDKIGWIFREQPIIDVGLDAIIEEVIDNEPTGKFLAVQIKSGESNFYSSEKFLSHYVSNIHYEYWINLSIPIILVAHLPKENVTYWQLIAKNNFKKTKKRWKLEIPFSQLLDEKAKVNLTSLLSKQNDKSFKIFTGKDDEDEFALLEDIKCLSEATLSIYRLSEINETLTKTTNLFNERIISFAMQSFSEKNPQVYASYRGLANSIKIISKRMENEIEIFSLLYSVGIFTFEKIILQLHFHGLKAIDVGTDLSQITNLPSNIGFALESFTSLKNTMSTLVIKHPSFEEAKKQFLEVMEFMCFELNVAKKITENLIFKIHELGV